MKKIICLFALVMLLSGCSGFCHRLGRGLRAAGGGIESVEVQDAYDNGELTKAQYLDLKMKAQQLNNERMSSSPQIQSTPMPAPARQPTCYNDCDTRGNCVMRCN